MSVRSIVRLITPALITASVYIGLAAIERIWQLDMPNRGTIWWPGGFACAFCYVWGLKAAPGVFLAEWFVACYYIDCPLALGLFTGTGNAIEAILCSRILLLLEFSGALDERDVRVLALASVISPVPMLALQVPAMWYFNLLNRESVLSSSLTFWANDMLAIAYVVPLFSAFPSFRFMSAKVGRYELALLFLLQTIATVTVFSVSLGSMFAPLVAIQFPFLAWSALRFGPKVMAVALAHYAAVMAMCMSLQLDPFPKVAETAFPYVHALLFIALFSGYLMTMLISARDKDRERLSSATRRAWITRLNGGVAHVLNNQLTVLESVDELRDSMTTATFNESLSAYTEGAIEKIRSLASSLLAVAGRGVHPAKRDVLDLNSIVDAVVMQGKTLADHELNVLGDADLLKVAIENLLQNAHESDHNPIVQIRTFSVRLTAASLTDSWPSLPSPGDFAAVQVSDNGCGMSLETRSQMFEPFYTTKEIGRGLGLTAVLGIVLQMNGLIKVETSAGSGTVVTLLFPKLVKKDASQSLGFV